MKIHQLGWILAAGVAAFAITSGFEGNSDKVGFVDFKKVYDGSKLKADQSATIQSEQLRYKTALQFIQLNPVFSQDQMKDYETLIEVSNPTADQQKKITQIQTDVANATKQFQTLSQKPNLTTEENNTLTTLGHEDQFGQNVLPQLEQVFERKMAQFSSQQQIAAESKIRAAVSEVAKKQGYSIVFNDRSAVYGSNDLTDATVKQLDK